MRIEELLYFLPSKIGFERDMSVDEEKAKIINPCGDKQRGFELHKLLTREGIMITYVRVGNLLKYYESCEITRF
jgi:hypothetical protein